MKKCCATGGDPERRLAAEIESHASHTCWVRQYDDGHQRIACLECRVWWTVYYEDENP